MDNVKSDRYYVERILNNVKYLLNLSQKYTREEMLASETIMDSICFRFVQIAENASKLTVDFKNEHKEISWTSINGLRNRIVHDYGHTDERIVLDTLENDIPKLREKLESSI